jgi:glycosyltransferase involved in cell wall biosynthesis
MKLHLLGLPHTVTDDAHHHCAYTAKVQKLPAMMRPHGYEIIHYGVAGAQTASNEHVDIMTRAEQNGLRGHDGSDHSKFVGDDGDISTPLYKEFNRRLRNALRERVALNDLVLLPFGWGHAQAVHGLPFTLVESGIGYPNLYDGATNVVHRIYESYAWLHYHHGMTQRIGINYEWVIPNYFDVDEWTARPKTTPNTVVYLGRLTPLKGLPTVVEIAHQRPDLHIIICGQGDPTPYLTEPNIEYRAPITGRARSDLLGNAMAVLMPSIYAEPFGGVNVEAQLCGTPMLTTDCGAFTETVEDEVTGFRCHTLGDWLAGLERAPELDRKYIAARARRLYGFERVGKMYDRAFQQINDLVTGAGWYSPRSAFRAAGTPEPAIIPPRPPVATDEQWTEAQKWELEWWMRPECDLAAERVKQDFMLKLMGPFDWSDKSVIDVGGGPISPLLRIPARKGTVLDPLEFGAFEAAYKKAGISRIVAPLERAAAPGVKYDEVLMMNVLSHVQNLEQCVRNALTYAPVARIFEWCEVPVANGHPHTVTATRLVAAIDLTKWTILRREEGKGADGTVYCALVLQRIPPAKDAPKAHRRKGRR